MNKICAFTCFLLISLGAWSQNSNLIFFNNTGESFYVILNGIRQNEHPETHFKISNIQPAKYDVKLIFADGTTPDISKNVWVEAYGEYTLRIVTKKNKKKLRLYDAISLKKEAPNTQVHSIDYHGSATHSHDVHSHDHHSHDPISHGTHTHDDGTTHENHNVDPNVQTHTHDDGTVHENHDNDHFHNHDVHFHTDPNQNISEINYEFDVKKARQLSDTNTLVNQLKGINFASDKLEFIVKQLAPFSLISNQAIPIIEAFSFDGDILKMAQYCYVRLLDKQNVSKLYSLFKFETSLNEFKSFVAAHP